MHDADDLPTADQLAQAWTLAVAHTSFVPMSRRKLRAYLLVLTRDLLGAFAAEEFDRSVPYDVGTALVATHFTEVASLERTLAVLGAQLASAVTTQAGAVRLAALQARWPQATHRRYRTVPGPNRSGSARPPSLPGWPPSRPGGTARPASRRSSPSR